jgi:hypothetical protein
MKRLLFDFDIFRYRYGFAAQKTKETDSGEKVIVVEKPQAVADALLWGIRRALNLTGCRDYIGYLSGPNNFRLKIDPEYKANRKDSPKPYHYEFITNYLIECHDAVVTDGIEADDALAIQYLKDPENQILASIDKDLNQIPGWHWDIVKENLYHVDEIEAARSLYSQMLQGDRTDNITGIRGIGPVKADKLVQGCSSEDEMSDLVFRMYRDEFGEAHAVAMYNKNWALLRMLRSDDEVQDMHLRIAMEGGYKVAPSGGDNNAL